MVYTIIMHWTPEGVFWIAGFTLELILAVAIFRRGLHRKFPFFFAYLVLELIRTCVLFGIGRHHPPYFYAYWIGEAVVSTFGFFVIDEIFRNAFSKHLGLKKLGTAIFRYSLVLLVLASAIEAAVFPGNDADKLISAIFILKRAESFVRIGLVASLFLFVTLLGLSWNDSVVGIAGGFAAFGVGELAVLIIRMHYGSKASKFYIWSTMGVNFCQKLVWLAHLSSRSIRRFDESRKNLADLPAVVAEVGKMNEAAQTLLGR
jgi:hypothetical protein